MRDFVIMKHPDIDAPSGPTSREAYETVYKGNGWSIVEPASPESAPVADQEPAATPAQTPKTRAAAAATTKKE